MTNFEKKLKLLFDAQDFFREPHLDTVLTREADVVCLADDELEMLFAAGDAFSGEDEQR